MAPFRVAAERPPCPRCGLPMASRVVLDAMLEQCSSCGGVFVPRALVPRLDPLDLGGEILSVFEPGQPHVEAEVRYLKCPYHDEFMHRRLASPRARVIVDECRIHGIWFDRHELRALIMRIEADQSAGLTYPNTDSVQLGPMVARLPLSLELGTPPSLWSALWGLLTRRR